MRSEISGFGNGVDHDHEPATAWAGYGIRLRGIVSGFLRFVYIVSLRFIFDRQTVGKKRPDVIDRFDAICVGEEAYMADAMKAAGEHMH